MCELCAGRDGCRPKHTLLKSEPLNADDWAEVYHFMKYSYLPFIHAIVARARKRAGISLDIRPERRGRPRNP